MVVVLAAALAYRYHFSDSPPSEIERKLSEQWQRTESFRQSSFDLVQSALACGDTSGIEQPPLRHTTDDVYTMSTPNENMQRHDAVRQEWIDAVFGSDFFRSPSYQAPRQGVGLAKIPSYTAYTATIPPCADKVGMTLSNVALGVYVRSVKPESEAHVAGVQEGSILVSINNMGMLGELTKQGLERLWQYEGHFNPLTREQNPIQMTLILRGTLYTVTLLASAPFGISWASCGQYPLVQRSYSHAAQAGVQRGSLVAAINGISMRSMDHQVAAQVVSDLVQAQQEIRMTLVYTPPASRTSGVERAVTNTPTKRTAVSTDDGVEVRVHPLAYSIGTLFQHGAASSPNKQKSTSSSEGSVSELATQVALGQALAPTGWEKNGKTTLLAPSDRTYRPCPTLTSVIAQWSPWDAFAYCLLFEGSSKYNELVATPRDSQLYILQKTQDYEPFLLACVNVVCECSSQELMAKLLDQTEEDKAFRQCLYYLLRSYTATLESKQRMNSHVLEILQAAQLELTDRMQEESFTVQIPSRPRMLEQAPGSTGGEMRTTTTTLTGADDSVKETTEDNGDGHFSTPSKKKSVFRVFRKKSGKSPRGKSKSPLSQPKSPITSPATPTLIPTMLAPPMNKLVPAFALFDNMTRFLAELDSMCVTVERSLLKSISQKIADWALQPWSLSKQKALVAVTEGMRDALMKTENLPVVNPIESMEILSSVDPNECYILPSAHFPLLLTFNVTEKETASPMMKQERLYRTRIEVVSLRGSNKSPVNVRRGSKGSGSSPSSKIYFVQGAVAGVVRETGKRCVNLSVIAIMMGQCLSP